MRGTVKKLIPNELMPLARMLYRKARFLPTDDVFSPAKYRALPALKCRITYNVYGGYCVPESSKHRFAAQAILEHDIWEPATIDFIRSHCSDGDVIHAGTYFGDFLPAISKGVSLGAKIWAFEPSVENFRCAKITVEINDLTNVVLSNVGLGATHEQLSFRAKDRNGTPLGGASLIDATGEERVQIVRVDDVVPRERKVSVIQLDVEGHERQALEGGLETIRRCRPAIVLEILEESSGLISSDWFKERILRLGYERVRNVSGNVAFVPR